MKNVTIHEGIVCIDKPKGISSFKALSVFRRCYDIERDVKLGHAGTLDPRATGLLVVGVGKGTKELRHIVGLDKRYEATMLLGISTDSADLDGVVKEKKDTSSLDGENIKKNLLSLVGTHRIPIPAFSAMKYKGKRLYAHAREGRETPVIPRDMTVYAVENISCETVPYSSLSTEQIDEKDDISAVLVRCNFHVESGVYIRSLAEELGRRLSVPGTLAELRRTHVGEYALDGSYSLDDCII
ncbi:MAG: tRNA pseudouridine55 synthase [Flavobacteriaceae bacterium]|jgi:tRNA pseudouridine55 synthase